MPKIEVQERNFFALLGKTLDREVVPQREKSIFDRVRDALGV